MPSTAIMDLLPVSEVTFMLNWQQEISQQGGRPRTADVGEEYWIADIACALLTTEEMRRAEARIEALRGAEGSFYVWSPLAPYPLADLNGVILGSSNVTIFALGGDSKSLRLGGLPVGYTITEGDLFHFETGSAPARRCLHRFAEGGVADGNGRTGMLALTSHLRAGVETGLPVTLKKPAAEMFIVPGSFRPRAGGGSRRSITFQAQQVP